MDNLKLPEIPLLGSVPSAAGDIERAGAKFKGATDAASGVLAEMDLAQINTENQEATVQLERGLNDVLDIGKSNPYVTPDEVKGLFGGSVPPGLELDEEVVGPGGKLARQPKKVIAMHEVLPHLFNERASQVVETAVRNIRGSGWQQKFREAAAADVEKARDEAMAWARGQRLADLNIRSRAQYEQAMAAKSWATAEAILNGPGMTVETREALAAEHEHRRTVAELTDSIRTAATPEALDSVADSVAANEVGEGKLRAPLSADERFKFTEVIRTKQGQMAAAAEAAQKRAYKARLEGVGNNVEAAVATAKATSTSPIDNYPGGIEQFHTDAAGLDTSDYMTLLNHMKAAPGSGSNEPTAQGWAIYTDFADKQKKKLLVDMPVTEVFKHRAALGNKYDEVLGWWRAAKEEQAGGGPAKFALSDRETGLVDNVIRDFKKLEPKNGMEFGVAQGQLTSAMVAWRKEHPEDPITYANVLEEGRRIWRKESDKDDIGARATFTAALPTLTGRPVTDGDIEAHQKALEEQRPIVEEAYASTTPEDKVVLDSGLRAEVYLLTQNPITRQLLSSRLEANKQPVNDRSLVFEAMRAVRDSRIPADEGRAYEAKQAEKVTREATSRQVQAAGAEIRAQDEASAAARSAEEKRLSDAEHARWRALPTWEQEAELQTKQIIEDDSVMVERQVRAKVMAEDRTAQLAAAKGKGPFGGDAAIMGEWPAGHPRRIALEDRIKAETAELLAQHRPRIEAQMAEAKVQYRKFLERVEAKEPAAVKAYQELYLDSFPRWFQMRREGKVF